LLKWVSELVLYKLWIIVVNLLALTISYQRICILTFGEETCFVSRQVPTQEPAISKVIVAFCKFDFITTSKTKLVGASGFEVVY